MTIALYLRLSDADGDLGYAGKTESNSIENQRTLLQAYLKARDDLKGEVVEYVDDGYSGTNFDRPAFKKMIEDAKKGKVQIVLVKDLSRLGRDYITVGDYIEHIFPVLHVRLIAANNGFDSAEHMAGNIGFDVAVNNLINTFYSRDLSQKIKSARLVKWKKGLSTSPYAPFGYLKSPNKDGTFVIDPEAAKIVRRVFDEALSGKNTSQIADVLNTDGVPTASIYNLTHHLWRLRESIVPLEERKWSPMSVRAVLVRREYTGAMVQGKKHILGVGARSIVQSSESDWVVVENVNEPIVSKEEFTKANMVIRSVRKPTSSIPHDHVLKGKVRCGTCKRALAHILTGEKETYHCAAGRGIGKHSGCDKDEFPVKQVETIVWYATKELLDILKRLCGKVDKRAKQRIRQIAPLTTSLPETLSKRKEEKLQQYELYADGAITKEQYLQRREELTQQIESLQTRIEQTDADYGDQQELSAIAQKFSSLASQYRDEKLLTREVVEAFIKNVYIYGKKRIEIEFKNEDEIHKMLNSMKKRKDIWKNEPKILPDEE